MTATTNIKTSRYKILQADLSSSRLVDGFVSLANRIGSFTLYEHLDKPYITGTMMILDDGNILDDINFSGTETLKIRLSGIGAVLEGYLSYTFVVNRIIKSYKINDRTVVYEVSLIDQIGFLDTCNRFSKSYKGRLENIISNICSSQLGKSVDVSKTASAQEEVRVVVPYMTSLTACSWLKGKMTTTNGSPWYLFAQLQSDNLSLVDLDTLLSRSAVNKYDFIYSLASKEKSQELGTEERSSVILAVSQTNMENTLLIIQQGGIASNTSALDIHNGKNISHSYTARDVLDNLQRSGVIKSGYEQNVFDTHQTLDHSVLGNKKVDAYNSRYFHTISSGKTYPDINNISSIKDASDLKNKAASKAIRSLLFKNSITIEMWAADTFAKKISIGDIISVKFISSTSQKGVLAEDELYDENRSGDYLIYSMANIFDMESHTVSMGIVKLTKKPSTQYYA